MTTAPAREPGFWSRLFGGEPEYDSGVYDRSLASGSAVLTVKAMDAHVATALQILESHHPVDIDERVAAFGQTSMATTDDLVGAAGTTGMASTVGVSRSTAMPGAGMAAPMAPVGQVGMRTADEGGMIQLAEESLAVGKRLINRGGTRIRRYVVETPVEESVSLHSEKVTLERRPVTDGRPVTDANFGETVIEMTETAEEAVVAKTARVVEEVGLRKEASDRVETIRDTIRKEEVEIEQIPGDTTTTMPGTLKTRDL